MRAIVITFVISLAVLAAVPAFAQVEMRATPPAPPERLIIEPGGDQYKASRPTDADYYVEPPRVRYDPAFVAPLSRKTETGRVGGAGWTSPSTPVGSRQIWGEVNGWFALGFAVEWGAPPPARRPTP
jgi:hypothetical protein